MLKYLLLLYIIMNEDNLKKLYQQNQKSFLDIFIKEEKNNGFGALFMDVLKNELKIYYLPYVKIPSSFQQKIKKNKKNIIMLSNDFIIYIYE